MSAGSHHSQDSCSDADMSSDAEALGLDEFPRNTNNRGSSPVIKGSDAVPLQEGAFNAEITPLKIKVKGKEVDFVVDEHPRPKTTLDGPAKLPSLFKKNGVVTAGTASRCDLGIERAFLLSPFPKLLGA
uniref:Thiolase N-terminal domain-containing protein n=1 Tax=Glossina palpalis gambiensis TaxID=67801 RepID=A0A1B0C088_9MUSC